MECFILVFDFWKNVIRYDSMIFCSLEEGSLVKKFFRLENKNFGKI